MNSRWHRYRGASSLELQRLALHSTVLYCTVSPRGVPSSSGSALWLSPLAGPGVATCLRLRPPAPGLYSTVVTRHNHPACCLQLHVTVAWSVTCHCPLLLPAPVLLPPQDAPEVKDLPLRPCSSRSSQWVVASWRSSVSSPDLSAGAGAEGGERPCSDEAPPPPLFRLGGGPQGRPAVHRGRREGGAVQGSRGAGGGGAPGAGPRRRQRPLLRPWATAETGGAAPLRWRRPQRP